MGDGKESGPMIEAEGLAKHYGQTQALASVGFAVPAGTILGLLGPNGAGKTTAVRILATLALPDAGRATVAGIDVVKHPGQVRRYIGVAAQDVTLDPLLTGRQNLAITGELSGMRRTASQARAADLLAQFELADAADRVVKGYSGGMRRRLDLAASLITRPPVLFLDEPTTGLDPAGRQPDVLLARTRMLWKTYGNQIDLERLKVRARPLDLLREATGLDFDDITALTLAYHGYIRAHQPGLSSAVNAFAGIAVSRETVETYLASFASTVDELAGKLAASPGSWQMLPIQERPLLRVGEALLVLDEQYLIERATQGLYWFVHEHERDIDGKRGWKLISKPRSRRRPKKKPSAAAAVALTLIPSASRPADSTRNSAMPSSVPSKTPLPATAASS